MSKWFLALTIGAGMVIGGSSVADAKRVIKRGSLGVKMTCFAGSKRCTFKNKRPRRMKCNYSISFKLRKGRRKLRTKRGVIVLAPRRLKGQKYYFGRFPVKKLFTGTLRCRRL